MGFSDLLPGLEAWTRSLGGVWPAPLIKSAGWAFPTIQTVHLIAMAMLAGSVLVLNLRLARLALTQTPADRVERALRPLLLTGLALLLVTGVLMALVIAPRLYARPGFLVKMIALAAALLLSLGFAAPTARRNGGLTMASRYLALAGLALWLAAVAVFGTSQGAAPGAFHVVMAGWLIVMGLGSGRTRLVLGVLTAVIVLSVGWTTYGVLHPLDDYDLVMEINRWTVRAAALLVAGFLAWEFGRPSQAPTETAPAVRMAALVTILAWVTVAAAGRWIGLGGPVE